MIMLTFSLVLHDLIFLGIYRDLFHSVVTSTMPPFFLHSLLLLLLYRCDIDDKSLDETTDKKTFGK